jgi:integrase
METQEQAKRMNGEGSIYQDRNGYFLFSMMHEGKRLVRSLKTKDEDEATRNAVKVRNEFGGRIASGEFEPSNVKNFTVGEAIKRYLDYLNENGRASAPIVALSLGVLQRDRNFLPRRKVANLTTQDFKDYRARETANEVSHTTVNNRFALLRAALKLEMKQTPSCVSKLPYIPMVHIDNARDGFLEYTDHHTLVAELPRSLKALFVIAFHSGCRLGEILNMRWSDVDWRNRNIRLPKTKNGTKRNLPFWGGIESHLKAQKDFRDAHHQDAEEIFFWCAEDCGLSHGGVRVAPGSPIQDFRASWSAAVKRAHTANANINSDLLFHDLRRSAVRCMIQDTGIPESQAMLISGHKTRTMLERYNIVSLKNVQDAGAKLDAWSRALATPAATSNT